jgi:hypothetical protein
VVLVVSVHLLVCIYIAIGELTLQNDLGDPWLIRLGLDDASPYIDGSDGRFITK